jgi:hypothetical protein
METNNFDSSSKRTRSSHSLGPGWFVHFDDDDVTYRIKAYVDNNPLLFELVDAETGRKLEDPVSYEALLLRGKDGDKSAPIIRRTLQEIKDELAARRGSLDIVIAGGTSDERFMKCREEAKRIISIVREAQRVMENKEREWLQQSRMNASKPFPRTEALNNAYLDSTIPVHPDTFRRYLNKCRRSSWNADLMAAKTLRRTTWGVPKLNRVVEHFMDTMILRYYSPDRGMSLRYVYKELIDSYRNRSDNKWIDPTKCEKGIPDDLKDELLNPLKPMQAILSNPEKVGVLSRLPAFSESTFKARARILIGKRDAGREFINGLYGKNAWESEHLAFDTFVHRATMPLQYVFTDHYLVDVFTVDKETRSKLSRLWLTVFIDAYSRSILGFILLYEPPSIMSIMKGLRHAIFPKTSHLELGIEGSYPVFGIPDTLIMDNAWAHQTETVIRFASEISQDNEWNTITPEWKPPYMARRGALVERFFGNVSMQIKAHLRKAGAILSSKPEDVRAARDTACLIDQDLHVFMNELVVGYQNTPHSGLGGMTPNEKFLQGIENRLPLVPPLTPEVERLFLRLFPGTRAKSPSKGICAFGMHYWSNALAWADEYDANGNLIEYEFRYDPYDISWLALYRGGKYFCDVYAKELRREDYTDKNHSVDPMSILEKELRTELVKSAGGSARDWLTPQAKLAETTKRRISEKRAAGKKVSTVAEDTLTLVPSMAEAHAIGLALSASHYADAEDRERQLRAFAFDDEEEDLKW